MEEGIGSGERVEFKGDAEKELGILAGKWGKMGILGILRKKWVSEQK